MNTNIILKVAAVIINSKQQKLLIKEQYTRKGGFKWNMVKGTLDDSDETIEECIKREIQEETGLVNFGAIVLKRIYHYGTSEQLKILFVFDVQCIGNEIPTINNNNRDENISEIKWFSKKEIDKLKKKDCMAFYVYDSIKTEIKKDVIKEL